MAATGVRFDELLDRGASLFERFTRWDEGHALPVLVLSFAVLLLVYYPGELLDALGFSTSGLSVFYTVHDVPRLLFIIPIAFATYHFGVEGSILTMLAAMAVFITLLGARRF